uniref:Inhibitor of growth protein n=1 Tax=Phallusia mammillata TaxID=59560 RepID=A0A6F9DFE1_9ASCI|nr:inhibitor of growth protein 3 [Phallusia mammillata]
MLYLEDYLELIEHLPSDLSERLTDMREMDLQVQNTMDSLKDRAGKLFQKCSIKKAKIPGADEAYEEIKKEYYKVLEEADEKVQLANQIYDLVDRHLRKLDQELSKFKMELEADNAGITEILEQRSLELDSNNQQRVAGFPHKEKRQHSHHVHQSASAPSLVSMVTSNGDGPPDKKTRIDLHSESDLLSHLQSESPGLYPELQETGIRSLLDEALQGRANVEVTDVSDVKSQDISLASISTQDPRIQLSSQPSRRTSANKTDQGRPMESVSRFNEFEGLSVDTLDTSGEIVSDSSIGSAAGITVHRPSRTKKQTSKAAAWVQERMKQAEARHEQRKKEHHTGESSLEQPRVEVVGEGASVEWTYDPNEPRYCVCNHVSYGEMVGCDNDKCPIEWFHYGCVGLVEAPKGKWYCPQCTQTMKRRNKAR